ncbi:MAG: hypothetical protein J0L75_20005 [Spirochaetes bacterium]|nr:hypothetical protein [Spirochaetota bacterium]
MSRTRALTLAVRGLHAFHPLAVGAGLFAVFHLVYFRVNLAEWMAPGIERWVLPGYLLLPMIILAAALWRAVRPPEDPLLWLERGYALDFRLLNAVHGLSDEGSDAVLADVEPASLLARFPWRPWAISVSLLFAALAWHLFSPNESARFLSNARSLWELQTTSLSLRVPDTVREGETAGLAWDGAFESAELEWRSGERGASLHPTRAQPVVLGPLERDLEWKLTLKRGRYLREETGLVRVFQKPRLVSLAAELSDVLGNRISLSGVGRFEALPDSAITVRLGLQGDQAVKRILGLPPGAASRWERTPSGAALFFKAPASLSLALRAVNEQDLTNEAPWMVEVTVPENRPPTIVLESPRDPVVLDLPAELAIDFTAEDDLALKRVALFLERPGEAARSRELTLPPSLRRHAGRAILAAQDLSIAPGQTLRFWLEAEDGWGLRGRSLTNMIHRPSRGELVQARSERLEGMAQKAERLAREAQELERGAEQANLDAERGKSDPARMQALGERLRDLRQETRDLASAVQGELSRQGATNQAEALGLSEEILAKLRRLDEALRQLDRDTLSKVQRSWSDLMQRLGEKPLGADDWKRALEAMTSPRFGERLDNMMKSLEELSRKQGLEDLAQLAEAIHRKAEDLRSESLAEDRGDPWNRAREGLSQELADLRQAWEKKRDSLAPKDGDDPVDAQARAQLDRDLDPSFERDLAKTAVDKKSFDRMDDAAKRLDRIRRNLDLLSRHGDELDRELAKEEIARQVAGFLHHGLRALGWVGGELVDPERTLPEVQNREAAGLFTESAAFAGQGRLALYSLLAPSMPALSPVLERWRRYEDSCQAAARAMDPSGRQGALALPPSPEFFLDRRREALDLVKTLLDLSALLDAMDQENAQSEMDQLSERQGKMGKRARQQMNSGRAPSPAQQEYMRQLAAEQAAIQRLMERLGKGNQGNQSGTGRGEEGNRQGNEAGARRQKELEETLSAMKRAEEALRAGGPDRERLQTDLKKIEENLLKFQSGLKERKDKEDPERESRTAKQVAPTFVDPGRGTTASRLRDDARYRAVQGAPGEWQDRMKAFLDAAE